MTEQVENKGQKLELLKSKHVKKELIAAVFDMFFDFVKKIIGISNF